MSGSSLAQRTSDCAATSAIGTWIGASVNVAFLATDTGWA